MFIITPHRVERYWCCDLMETNSIFMAGRRDLERASNIPKKNAKERLCFSYKKVKL